MKHIQNYGFNDFINHTFTPQETEGIQFPLPLECVDIKMETVLDTPFEETKRVEEEECMCQQNKGSKCCCKSEVKPSSTLTLTTENNKVQLDLNEDLYAAVPGQSVTTTKDNKVTLTTDDEYGGFYTQMDQNVNQAQSYQEGIEVMNLGDAIKKYPWIKEKYMWTAVDKNKDEATKAVAVNDEVDPKGYCVIAHPGVKCTRPVNSQLIMEQNHHQYVHNIMIAFPGSELTIASTCMLFPSLLKSQVPSSALTRLLRSVRKKTPKVVLTMVFPSSLSKRTPNSVSL